MNILLIGSGGREHALAWKLAQSPSCDFGGTDTLYAAPGNPGIAQCATCIPIDPGDHGAVIDFCRDKQIGLVVIGPEVPLTAGLADDLRAASITVFGPGAAAAQLEGSKGFTKDLCSAANIPTAAYERFTTASDAIAHLDHFTAPYVIKADGLAAGKGVIIAQTGIEAEAAIADMFSGSFGAATGRTSASIVIEDFMEGEEVSFFALSDGKTVIPFASAQDHKRVGEGDTGPNTGGMGAYSPASIFPMLTELRVMRDIVTPTIEAMAARGTPFSGVLFAGLMLTRDGPKLIEYNVRFGDPETQVILARFKGDLAQLLLHVASGTLDQAPRPDFVTETALTVVVAAQGYPGTPEKGPKKGGAIAGIDSAQSGGALVFHAGTAIVDGQLVASGGRVLSVTGRGTTIATARAAAYQAVDRIDFADGFCRRDIGWREIERMEGRGE
jgi:phosphoribosylamine---glycine ligase